MSKEFEDKWKTKLAKEREKVLFWDRPFLPKPPHIIHLTEESVVLYLKKIKPQLRRANNRFLRFVDWFLFDLVFGGLVVLGTLGVLGGCSWLVYFLLNLHPIVMVLGCLVVALLQEFIFVFFAEPVWWWFVVVRRWLGRLRDKNKPHPVEMVKQVLNEMVKQVSK